MGHVAIIGAGIAGLTAGLMLRRRGHNVTVFEADGRAGGVIRSITEAGFTADLGPNSMLPPPPLVRGLLQDLELTHRQLHAAPAARRRFVVRGGRPVPIPASPLALLFSPLLSLRAKGRILREPWVSSRSDGEESLAELVGRRLGQEVVDYLLTPMVAGVYAGDPTRLSAEHAMPVLGSLETRYGSLLGGAVRLRRERKLDRDNPEGRMCTFRGGMEVMPAAMADQLGGSLALRTRVEHLTRIGEGAWMLTLRGPAGATRRAFDAVIATAPAYALARIRFDGRRPDLWHSLSKVRYTPVAVVVNGYRRAEVRHPLDGFGMLVPAVERHRTLGTLFSSTLFPDRAPAGHVTLTTFVGGARDPELAIGSEAVIGRAVEQDLKELLGVSGKPTFRAVQQWPLAIPQYEVGFGERKQEMDQLERENPGLYLAGSFRNGVAVGEVMTSGALCAEAVSATLQPAADRPAEWAI